jgi:hypothetical protein
MYNRQSIYTIAMIILIITTIIITIHHRQHRSSLSLHHCYPRIIIVIIEIIASIKLCIYFPVAILLKLDQIKTMSCEPANIDELRLLYLRFASTAFSWAESDYPLAACLAYAIQHYLSERTKCCAASFPQAARLMSYQSDATSFLTRTIITSQVMGNSCRREGKTIERALD